MLPNVLIALLILWVIIYFITVYNGIISLHNQVNKAWYNINVLLKQRHDQIPNLVKVCREYMLYEQQVLEEIVNLRSLYNTTAQIRDLGSIDQGISQQLAKVFALAENYADLKADENYQYVFKTLQELEMKIADNRSFYNDYVENYNNRVERFPDNCVAFLCGYKKAFYFSIRGKTQLVENVGPFFKL